MSDPIVDTTREGYDRVAAGYTTHFAAGGVGDHGRSLVRHAEAVRGIGLPMMARNAVQTGSGAKIDGSPTTQLRGHTYMIPAPFSYV